MTTSTAVPYKATAHLIASVTITFQGVEYVIIKVNPKNYVIANKAGKRYTLNRRSPGITTEGKMDFAWFTEANIERANAKAEAQAQANAKAVADPSDDAVGIIQPGGYPRFKVGERVVITGKRTGKWEGKEGVIIRVNKIRYSVVTDKDGQVNVPFVMTRRPAANGLDF